MTDMSVLSASEAVQFLKWLDPREGARFDFRALDPTKKRGAECRTFFSPELEGDAFGAWLRQANKDRNVYVSLNCARANAPRDQAIDGEQIGLVRAFTVDIDTKDGRTKQEAIADLMVAEEPPTLIVDSGNGVWGHWVLEKPATVESLDAVAQNKALIAQFGGDPKCHDLPRITRLPGTINHKPGQPATRSRLFSANGPLCKPEDLARAYPPAAPTAAAAPQEAPDGLELDAPASVARAVAWLLTDAPEAISGEGGDAVTLGVAMRCKDFGLSRACTGNVMLDYWNPIKAIPAWDASELLEKVRNAYEYGSAMPGKLSPALAEVEFPAVDIPEKPTEDIFEVQSVATFEWNSRRDYLVKYLIGRRQIGIIAAPPNAGKSPVLMDLGASIALGQPFNGLKVREAAYVLYYATEGDYGIGNRYQAVRHERGFVGDASVPYDFRVGRLVLGAADPVKTRKDTQKLIRTINARAAHYGKPPGLVVIDTASQAISGTDSDDNIIRNLIASCKEIIRQTGAAVILAAHPPKSGDSMIRGSGVYVADADLILTIEVDPKTKIRSLISARGKDDLPLEKFRFRAKVVDLGADDEGDPMTAPAVEWLSEAEVEMQVLPERNDEIALKALNGLIDDKIEAGKVGAFTFTEGLKAFTNAKNAKKGGEEIGAELVQQARSGFNAALTRLVQLSAFEKVGEGKRCQYVRPR